MNQSTVETVAKVADSAQWRNRLQITSADSGSTYIIAQRASDLTWCCSCPAFTRRRERACKHLTALGLALTSTTPVADVIDAIGRLRWNAQQIRATAGVSAKPAPKPKSAPAPKPRPLRSVDLVAVAFEWECSSCCHQNREEEVGIEVSCANCSARFKVGKFRRSR